jgi:tetratricopeptide (TPR) repeat protein
MTPQRSERTARLFGVPGSASPSGRIGRLQKRASLFLLAPAVLGIALFATSCGNGPSPSSAADSLVSQGLHAESAGHSHLAATDFRSAAAKNRSDAVPYYELGVLYQRLHNSTQAAMAYKQALSIDPKYKKAMFNLAVVDTPTQPQAAMNLYNELLLRNPKDAQVNFNLGLLLIAQLQPSPGHELLKHAVTLEPALTKQLPAGITP